MRDDDDLLDDDELDEDTMENRYLTFRIAAEDYGIEIRHVTEIVGMQRITEVPDMPEYVQGVMNLRGSVIPVIDVRTRFGLEIREHDDRTCIIVVHLGEMSVGLIVDTVQEVIDIPADQVAPPPSVRRSTATHFVAGLGKVGEQVKILLDVQKLLRDEDMAAIAEVAE